MLSMYVALQTGAIVWIQSAGNQQTKTVGKYSNSVNRIITFSDRVITFSDKNGTWISFIFTPKQNMKLFNNLIVSFNFSLMTSL